MHTKTLPVPRIQLESLPSELAPLVQSWILVQQEQRARAVFVNQSLSFSVPAFARLSTRDSTATLRLDHDNPINGLDCVAGLDISFHPDNKGLEGVATIAVCSFPDMKLLYLQSEQVSIDVPYVPSFLSFREAPFYKSLFDSLPPDIRSQIQLVFVDGNGRLHSREAGSAVAIGQACGLPTIGVAKEYFPIQDEGDAQDEGGRPWQASQKGMRERCRQVLKERGDWFEIVSPHGDHEAVGAAIITSPDAKSRNPVFVSSGHRVSLETALQVTFACCLHARVPEPIRIADRLGREEVKRVWGETRSEEMSK